MKHAPPSLLIAAIALCASAPRAQADVTLPHIFADHMVVQREVPIRVWGSGAPGETLRVRVASSQELVQVAADGSFMVELDPLPAGGPHVLSVTGASDTEVRADVMVGEVWLCSGQSNMTWSLELASNGDEEVRGANHRTLRLFEVARVESEVPIGDTDAEWKVCTPEQAKRFSAVAYFFGRELLQELDVPIGLIAASWPGTPCEVWADRDWIANTPGLESLITNMPPIDPGRPPIRTGVLWNGMLRPIVPYRMRGAIFYQGESNVARAHQYRQLFPEMIRQWRTAWRQGDFPFYYVQIAPFQYESNFNLPAVAAAELREAQLLGMSVPNTGMVVTTDIADPGDLHPPNKQDVGARLAGWALADVYGRDQERFGPIFDRIEILGNVAQVTLRNIGAGITTNDGLAPTDFTLAGADGVYHPASVTIVGDNLFVTSLQVPQPVTLRFAWDDDPTPNLVGLNGLPLPSFRTDRLPDVTEGNE